MFNTYRDPTSCYGDQNIATFPQNVEDSNKIGQAAAWQVHAAGTSGHNMPPHTGPTAGPSHYHSAFHHHSTGSAVDAYGYSITQVHKETDPTSVKDHVRSTPTPNTTNTNAAWQNNRSRYSGGVNAGGAFLPYPQLGHFEGSSLDAGNLIHGHSHGRKPTWPVENSFSSIQGQQYQRDPSMVYADNHRTNVTTSIIRHTTNVSGIDNRTVSSQQHAPVQQHLHQQQQQPLLHPQQQHPAPHHALFSQLVQKEREARRLPGYQESVRHSVVRNRLPSYPEPLFSQHQHPQYCDTQEMLRKPPLQGATDRDRCSAFTARQGPAFNHGWGKSNMPYLQYHPQMPPTHRALGSAFQPCGKVPDADLYPGDSLMWSKPDQGTGHSQVPNGHPLRSVHSGQTGWIHDAQSIMFPSRQMHKQGLPANNHLNMLNMDTGQLEPHSNRVATANMMKDNIHQISYQTPISRQHIHQHALHMNQQIVHHQPPPPPPPLPPSQQQILPQHQQQMGHPHQPSPLSNSQHSPIVHSPHASVQSPCPQQPQHMRGEDEPKDSNGNARRSLRSCLDVRQFLATWDEDTDIGTPRPCVEESEIGENVDQPLGDPDPGALVVLESRSLQREEAANLLNMYPSVNIDTVSAADGLLACSGENMFSGSSEAVVMDSHAVAQGVLQNLLDSACGTSSGSNSTTIATPMTSPSCTSGARTLDLLLCGALPTPPASQEHNMLQTCLPLNTPVNMPVLTNPASPRVTEPLVPAKLDGSGFGLLSPSSPPLSLKFDVSVNAPLKFPAVDECSSVIQSCRNQMSFGSLPLLEGSDKREVSVIAAPVSKRAGQNLEPVEEEAANHLKTDVSRVVFSADADVAPSPAPSDVSTDSKKTASLRAFRKRKLQSPNGDIDLHDSYDSHHSHDALESHAKSYKPSSVSDIEDTPLDRSKWAFAQIHQIAKPHSVSKFTGLSNAPSFGENWDFDVTGLEGKPTRERGCSSSEFQMVDRGTTPSLNIIANIQKSNSLKYDKSTSPSVVLSNKDTQTEESRQKVLASHSTDADLFSDEYAQTSVRSLQDEIGKFSDDLAYLDKAVHFSSIEPSEVVKSKRDLNSEECEPLKDLISMPIDSKAEKAHIWDGGSLKDSGPKARNPKGSKENSNDGGSVKGAGKIVIDSKSDKENMDDNGSNPISTLPPLEANDAPHLPSASSSPKLTERRDNALSEESRYQNVKEEVSPKYLSRIVDSSPGNIPKILLSRLRHKSSDKNGVIKKLPSIRLTRVNSPMSNSGSEPEYVCSVSDSEAGTPSRAEVTSVATDPIDRLCHEKDAASQTSDSKQEPLKPDLISQRTPLDNPHDEDSADSKAINSSEVFEPCHSSELHGCDKVSSGDEAGKGKSMDEVSQFISDCHDHKDVSTSASSLHDALEDLEQHLEEERFPSRSSPLVQLLTEKPISEGIDFEELNMPTRGNGNDATNGFKSPELSGSDMRNDQEVSIFEAQAMEKSNFEAQDSRKYNGFSESSALEPNSFKDALVTSGDEFHTVCNESLPSNLKNVVIPDNEGTDILCELVKNDSSDFVCEISDKHSSSNPDVESGSLTKHPFEDLVDQLEKFSCDHEEFEKLSKSQSFPNEEINATSDSLVPNIEREDDVMSFSTDLLPLQSDDETNQLSVGNAISGFSAEPEMEESSIKADHELECDLNLSSDSSRSSPCSLLFNQYNDQTENIMEQVEINDTLNETEAINCKQTSSEQFESSAEPQGECKLTLSDETKDTSNSSFLNKTPEEELCLSIENDAKLERDGNLAPRETSMCEGDKVQSQRDGDVSRQVEACSSTQHSMDRKELEIISVEKEEEEPVSNIEDQLSPPEKCWTSNSNGSFTLSDEERAFPDPAQPDFDVTRIPLPDECEALKNRLRHLRGKKRHEEPGCQKVDGHGSIDARAEAQDSADTQVENRRSTLFRSFLHSDKSYCAEESRAVSVAVQCSQVIERRRTFGFQSKASQTHKIKIKLRPRFSSTSISSPHVTQTLMEVVDEVSQVLEDRNISSHPIALENPKLSRLTDLSQSKRKLEERRKPNRSSAFNQNCTDEINLRSSGTQPAQQNLGLKVAHSCSVDSSRNLGRNRGQCHNIQPGEDTKRTELISFKYCDGPSEEALESVDNKDTGDHGRSQTVSLKLSCSQISKSMEKDIKSKNSHGNSVRDLKKISRNTKVPKSKLPWDIHGDSEEKKMEFRNTSVLLRPYSTPNESACTLYSDDDDSWLNDDQEKGGIGSVSRNIDHEARILERESSKAESQEADNQEEVGENELHSTPNRETIDRLIAETKFFDSLEEEEKALCGVSGNDSLFKSLEQLDIKSVDESLIDQVTQSDGVSCERLVFDAIGECQLTDVNHSAPDCEVEKEPTCRNVTTFEQDQMNEAVAANTSPLDITSGKEETFEGELNASGKDEDLCRTENEVNAHDSLHQDSLLPEEAGIIAAGLMEQSACLEEEEDACPSNNETDDCNLEEADAFVPNLKESVHDQMVVEEEVTKEILDEQGLASIKSTEHGEDDLRSMGREVNLGESEDKACESKPSPDLASQYSALSNSDETDVLQVAESPRCSPMKDITDEKSDSRFEVDEASRKSVLKSPLSSQCSDKAVVSKSETDGPVTITAYAKPTEDFVITELDLCEQAGHSPHTSHPPEHGSDIQNEIVEQADVSPAVKSLNEDDVAEQADHSPSADSPGDSSAMPSPAESLRKDERSHNDVEVDNDIAVEERLDLPCASNKPSEEDPHADVDVQDQAEQPAHDQLPGENSFTTQSGITEQADFASPAKLYVEDGQGTETDGLEPADLSSAQLPNESVVAEDMDVQQQADLLSCDGLLVEGSAEVNFLSQAALAEVDVLEQALLAEVVELKQAPNAEVDVLEQAPLAEVDLLNQAPLAEVDVVEQAPLAEVDLLNQAPLAEVDVVEQAPLAEIDLLNQAPLAEVDVLNQAPLTDVDLLNQAPLAEADVLKLASLSEVDVLKRAPLAEIDVLKKAPLAEVDVLKQAPLAEVVLKQAPLAEVDVLKQEPLAEVNVLKQAPLAEVDVLKQAPFAEVDVLKQAPLAEVDVLKQAPLAEVDVLKQAPLAEVDELKQAPLAEVDVLKQAPLSDESKGSVDVQAHLSSPRLPAENEITDGMEMQDDAALSSPAVIPDKDMVNSGIAEQETSNEPSPALLPAEDSLTTEEEAVNTSVLLGIEDEVGASTEMLEKATSSPVRCASDNEISLEVEMLERTDTSTSVLPPGEDVVSSECEMEGKVQTSSFALLAQEDNMIAEAEIQEMVDVPSSSSFPADTGIRSESEILETGYKSALAHLPDEDEVGAETEMDEKSDVSSFLFPAKDEVGAESGTREMADCTSQGADRVTTEIPSEEQDDHVCPPHLPHSPGVDADTDVLEKADIPSLARLCVDRAILDSDMQKEGNLPSTESPSSLPCEDKDDFLSPVSPSSEGGGCTNMVIHREEDLSSPYSPSSLPCEDGVFAELEGDLPSPASPSDDGLCTELEMLKESGSATPSSPASHDAKDDICTEVEVGPPCPTSHAFEDGVTAPAEKSDSPEGVEEYDETLLLCDRPAFSPRGLPADVAAADKSAPSSCVSDGTDTLSPQDKAAEDVKVESSAEVAVVVEASQEPRFERSHSAPRQISIEDDLPPLEADGLESATRAADSDSDREMPCLEPVASDEESTRARTLLARARSPALLKEQDAEAGPSSTFVLSKPAKVSRKEMPSANLRSHGESNFDLSSGSESASSCGNHRNGRSTAKRAKSKRRTLAGKRCFEDVDGAAAYSAKPAQGEELPCIEISDIRTVSVSDLSAWSGGAGDAGSDVVPVPVDSVYNWPYVEEVFTETGGDETRHHDGWSAIGSPLEGTCRTSEDRGRPHLRCSLSWDRILPEGERLVLGPAKIEVRLADSPTKGVACWNVISRDQRRGSAESVVSSCQEENNNLMPNAKSHGVMVKKIILKRPNDKDGRRSHSDPGDVESEQESGVEGCSSARSTLPIRSRQVKTKGALKSFQLAESDRALRRKRPWPLGRDARTMRMRGCRGSRAARSKRWYSELSSPRSGSTRSPGAPDPDVSCGEVPKVIIKRKNSNPDGGLTCYESFLQGSANSVPEQLRLRPVVLLCRNPELDVRAQELQRLVHRKRFKSDLTSSSEPDIKNDIRVLTKAFGASDDGGALSRRQRSVSEASDADSADANDTKARDLLQVVELLRRWRQEEEEKGVMGSETPPGQVTPIPLPAATSSQGSSCWDRMDADAVHDFAVEVSTRRASINDVEPLSIEPADDGPVVVVNESEHWSHVDPSSPLLSVSEGNPAGDDTTAHRCQACEEELLDADARAMHIKKHPYHCQRCYLAFPAQVDFMQHLKTVHPNTQQLHHCLLCLRTFPTEEQHAEHIKGWSHGHMERSQRRTIHALYRLFTGADCPRLSPLTAEEKEALDWLPNDSGVIHFYHQATPLQLATEDWHMQRGSDCSQPACKDRSS